MFSTFCIQFNMTANTSKDRQLQNRFSAGDLLYPRLLGEVASTGQINKD